MSIEQWTSVLVYCVKSMISESGLIQTTLLRLDLIIQTMILSKFILWFLHCKECVNFRRGLKRNTLFKGQD